MTGKDMTDEDKVAAVTAKLTGDLTGVVFSTSQGMRRVTGIGGTLSGIPYWATEAVDGSDGDRYWMEDEILKRLK